MIEMNVDEWLNKLESNITLAKKGFMTDSKLVDESACLECIAQIRSLLPSELSQARIVTKNAQHIKLEAQEEAKRIIDEANRQAQQLVGENRIVEEAKRQADQILQDASNYANNLVGQAYQDVAKLMDDAEAHSREILQVVLDTKARIFPQYDRGVDPNQQQQ